MSLPRLLVLTDRSQLPPGRSLVEAVAAAVTGGARAVLLRERDLPPPQRERLASDLEDLLDPVGGALIAATPALESTAGVHLRADDPWPTNRPGLVGRSCHDADELADAEAEGCDYVTLSPVAASTSKPGYGPALGAERFGTLAARTPLRVYALGGVTPDNAATWLRAGAYGVAVMGPIMRADDPAAATAAYLSAMGAAR